MDEEVNNTIILQTRPKTSCIKTKTKKIQGISKAAVYLESSFLCLGRVGMNATISEKKGKNCHLQLSFVNALIIHAKAFFHVNLFFFCILKILAHSL